MSRVPRAKEHLKTGFASEATSAAQFRACAKRAETDGRTNLARRWRELAEAKDELAASLLDAAGQVREPERAVADLIAEERYENDVLYPKMIREVSGETAEVLRRAMAAQQEHVERLETLRRDLQSAAGSDVA